MESSAGDVAVVSRAACSLGQVLHVFTCKYSHLNVDGWWYLFFGVAFLPPKAKRTQEPLESIFHRRTRLYKADDWNRRGSPRSVRKSIASGPARERIFALLARKTVPARHTGPFNASRRHPKPQEAARKRPAQQHHSYVRPSVRPTQTKTQTKGAKQTPRPAPRTRPRKNRVGKPGMGGADHFPVQTTQARWRRIARVIKPSATRAGLA